VAGTAVKSGVGEMKNFSGKMKKVQTWGATPSRGPLDISGNISIFTISTPAKPLPSMLNSGGFFFLGRFQG
jgi:hypothetical protein